MTTVMTRPNGATTDDTSGVQSWPPQLYDVCNSTEEAIGMVARRMVQGAVMILFGVGGDYLQQIAHLVEDCRWPDTGQPVSEFETMLLCALQTEVELLEREHAALRDTSQHLEVSLVGTGMNHCVQLSFAAA